MKAKFGAIVVAGSGKIGGHVFSKNRGGAFMRTKVTPANARTSYQVGVRNRFTALSQAWRSLTQAQRDGWNSSVADFAKTDIFGDLRNPSGINLHQRLNNVLNQLGIPSLTNAPAPAAVSAIVATGLDITTVPAMMSLITDIAVPAGVGYIICATPPLSAGKSSVNSQFRQIKADIGPIALTAVDILETYLYKFGSVGAIGQKVFVRFQMVNTENGQTGTPTIVSYIIEA